LREVPAAHRAQVKLASTKIYSASERAWFLFCSPFHAMIAVAEWETEATWAGPCSLVAAKKMAGATGIEAVIPAIFLFPSSQSQ
jgi:hypothetical protein